jgi:hypothetical protein
MKIIITESQYNRILKEEEDQKVLHIPSLKFFNNDPWEAWQILQEFLEKSGNPPYTIGGNLYLEDSSIEFLGNLISVEGDLDLQGTPLSKMYNKEQISQMVNVGGKIFM